MDNKISENMSEPKSDDEISIISNTKKKPFINRKKKLCGFWLENGWCKHGVNCIFAHGTRDINICASQVSEQEKWCNEDMAKAFKNAGSGVIKGKGKGKGKEKGKGKGKGKDNDNECEFDIERNVNSNYKTVICKFYKNGNCKNENCNYAHGENELKLC